MVPNYPLAVPTYKSAHSFFWSSVTAIRLEIKPFSDSQTGITDDKMVRSFDWRMIFLDTVPKAKLFVWGTLNCRRSMHFKKCFINYTNGAYIHP